MARLEIQLPDDLATRFKAEAAKHGGASVVMRKLMIDYLAEADGEVFEAEKRGPRHAKVTLALTKEEADQLDELAGEVGLKRATWARALLRSRLQARPVLTDAQALAFRQAVSQLHRIGVNVNQIARAINTEAADPDLRKSHLYLIENARAEISQHVDNLIAELRGNLAYWRGDDETG